MKRIGEILKGARLKKKVSFSNLEKETKIKREYIVSLEKEDWERLPEYPVLIGFTKNLAQALGIDREYAAATLRRDYPPKKLSVNPKPDVGDKFVWSPRLTFILGAIVTVLVALFYLTLQYLKFTSPPKLEISEPQENMVVTENIIKVTGVTDSDSVVLVNNQPAIVDDKGNFVTEIEVFEGTTEVKIVARSRSGKETMVNRSIKVEFSE